MSTTLRGVGRPGACSLRTSGGIAILDETYHYIVVATAVDEPYLSVITTSGLPTVNSTVTIYGVCRSISATRREANPKIWDVVAEFSSEVEDNQSSANPQSDPLVWVPVYETKFERIQEVVTKDFSGASIANSAGQPFDTGITVSRFIPIWDFYQFEPSTVTDEQIIERNEVVNSVLFKGRAAKTLLCTVTSSTVGFYYGRRMRFTRYQLRYNSKKWTHKRLDVGTVYKSGSDYLPYTDKAGNVIAGALDGSGGKQAVGTAPAVREFDQYDTKALASFLRI